MSYYNKKPIFLDVSSLEAPQPLERILEAIRCCDNASEYLEVKHRIEPKGLYPHLKLLECEYCINKDSNDEYTIKIWKRN